VGSAVAQLVPLLGGGLRIGTVGRAGKIPDARRAGWDVAISRADDVAAAVRASAAGGVDVVIDPSGTSQLELDLTVAAPGARIALFGNAGGGVPEPLPPLGRLIGANVALAGFSMSRLTATAPQRVTAALSRVLGWLGSGELEIAVTEVGSLEEVAAVHDLLAAGQGSGKYVARLAA
jgi:NADPH2:quinone reductase